MKLIMVNALSGNAIRRADQKMFGRIQKRFEVKWNLFLRNLIELIFHIKEGTLYKKVTNSKILILL